MAATGSERPYRRFDKKSILVHFTKRLMENCEYGMCGVVHMDCVLCVVYCGYGMYSLYGV